MVTKKELVKTQKDYIKAKQQLRDLEEQFETMVREYVREQKIVNSDGTIPTVLWRIEDDDVFTLASDIIEKKARETGLELRLAKAHERFKEMEEEAVRVSLEFPMISKKEKDTLTKGAKTQYKVRMELIDILLSINVKEIPSWVFKRPS